MILFMLDTDMPQPLNVSNAALTETDIAIATRMFGITLDEAFVKQKDVLPNLLVPRIVPLLVHAFYFLDGCKTEGVFRVPAFPSMQLHYSISDD